MIIKINISPRQLKELIQGLPVKERRKLIEDLKQSRWQDDFKALLKRIHHRFKKNPITEDEIREIVEEVRAENHAKGGS